MCAALTAPAPADPAVHGQRLNSGVLVDSLGSDERDDSGLDNHSTLNDTLKSQAAELVCACMCVFVCDVVLLHVYQEKKLH